MEELTIMAYNFLVPYKQDEEKWVKHYVERAMLQVNPDPMTVVVKPQKPVIAKVVTPTAQYIAQAKVEAQKQMKDEYESPEVYTPIKATPEWTVHPKYALDAHTHTPQRKKKRTQPLMKRTAGDIFYE